MDPKAVTGVGAVCPLHPGRLRQGKPITGSYDGVAMRCAITALTALTVLFISPLGATLFHVLTQSSESFTQSR